MAFNIFKIFAGGGNALADRYGTQIPYPSTQLIDNTLNISPDTALQISTVWRSVEILSKMVSTLPLNVYGDVGSTRKIAKESMLYTILHDSPNSRQTSAEFWGAMMVNLLLRGNAYARIQRDNKGECEALWCMPADQIEHRILDDGSEVYIYRLNGNIAVLASENVLHIKELGNGNLGFSRLEYMASILTETTHNQRQSQDMFSNGGKQSGFLMIDRVLTPEQREKLQNSYRGMVEGTISKIQVLEADMKFQPVTLSPQDQNLLATRQFSVVEISRFFGIPPILLHDTTGTTTLGSSAEEIIASFYKLTIRPLLVNIEQAIKKRVLTPKQRVLYTVEFNLDAVLRSSLSARMDIYSKAVQNGIFTRNECRILENDEPIEGGDILTAQSNLLPLEKLGVQQPNQSQSSIEQPTLQ